MMRHSVPADDTFKCSVYVPMETECYISFKLSPEETIWMKCQALFPSRSEESITVWCLGDTFVIVAFGSSFDSIKDLYKEMLLCPDCTGVTNVSFIQLYLPFSCVFHLLFEMHSHIMCKQFFFCFSICTREIYFIEIWRPRIFFLQKVKL